MNTTTKRDEIRRQKNKPSYVKCLWFEWELERALEEIDELQGTITYLEMELRVWKS